MLLVAFVPDFPECYLLDDTAVARRLLRQAAERLLSLLWCRCIACAAARGNTSSKILIWLLHIIHLFLASAPVLPRQCTEFVWDGHGGGAISGFRPLAVCQRQAAWEAGEQVDWDAPLYGVSEARVFLGPQFCPRVSSRALVSWFYFL